MEIFRIKDTRHPLWEEAWKLYETSFPLAEQRPLAQHIEAMKDEAFHCNLLTEFKDGQEILIGLLTWWDWTGEGEPTELRFVEHLAIRTDLRGGGYGAKTMEFLKNNGKRLMLLEIDPPSDDVSIRREQFYIRQGMVPNPEYNYVHPSFRAETEPHRLLIMSYPRKLTPTDFREFQNFNLLAPWKYATREK